MKNIFSILAVGIALVAGMAKAAEVSDTGKIKSAHAEVTVASEVVAVAAGKPFWVLVTFKLQDDWHIYWQNPGDSGLSPQLDWTLPQGFTTEAIHWPVPRRIPLEGLMDYGYEGEARLLVPVMPPETLQAGQTVELSLKANWLICHDICVPERGETKIVLATAEAGTGAVPSERHAAEVAEALRDLPKIIKTQGKLEAKDASVKLGIALPEDWQAMQLSEAYFYPAAAGIIKHENRQKWQEQTGRLETTIPKGTEKLPEALAGVLELNSDEGEIKYYRVEFSQTPGSGALVEDATVKAMLEEVGPAATPKATIPGWQAILFAVLGGVLLNAMPCVFPVLSLKALAISKKAGAGSRAIIRKQGLAYLAGTTLSFMALASLLIVLKQSGDAVGWGFQLQSPAFVAGMVYLFLLLGLALAGMYELPQVLGGLGNAKASKDSASGSFFTGILAVLVATPCTVPFMAPALSYAFTQSAAITLLVMVAMGLGLALPYLAICFYPSLQHRLPKPGAWMLRFKEFMAFPIFATSAWLVWVLAQQVSLMGLAVVLAMVVILPFLIWLGWHKPRGFQWGLTVVALLLVAYSFTLLSPLNATQVVMQESSHNAVPYNEQKLSELRAAQKPVFLDATAAWCITCKVNERVALNSPTLAREFEERGITFMIADWTNYDEAITRLLQRFNHQGVPLYVYFPPQGEPVVLPQLLTESIVMDAIKGEKDEKFTD